MTLGKFFVVGLPDTQKYSESNPQLFNAQTEWIAAHQAALNIQFVSHYGDVVENGTNAASTTEYARAVAALDILRQANVPHGITEGNHDSLPFGVRIPGIYNYDNRNFVANFGPQWYQGKNWYGGSSPSGTSSYHFFNGGGRTFLSLHIGLETPHAELAWAQGVINQHRDKPVMVTTHRYIQDSDEYELSEPTYLFTRQFESGRIPNAWYTTTPEILYNPNGVYAEDFFNHFVAANRNIFLVNSGHDAEEFNQTSVNRFGLPVHEVMADFTDQPNGGNGFLRLMEFDTGGDRINVTSYSPVLNQYLTDADSQFSLTVDFDQYRAVNPTVYFQNGVSGYQGTQDTWISEASRGSSYGNGSGLIVDDDVNNSVFSDRQGQALLRFDNIIGDAALGRIPRGAIIVRANLKLTVKDDIDNPLYDPDFRLYFMRRSWSESSTWDSLSSGLNVNSDYDELINTFSGDNDPNGLTVRNLNVTRAVQRWANGEANYGLGIISERISGNDDGIELYSSEASEIMFRPVLEVEYTLGSAVRTTVTAVNSLMPATTSVSIAPISTLV
ncbi:DNRLRE domain-containing protein [Oscillatoria sp. FACHB-1407]|uniref:DNRLRE domain-containing protein n=1 Tax=Oscillatoria sp. FACHB-1407 TaxID=2692847 RepID=UPI001685AE52|nr:DNRLRE domain-containing protein [Oscillatoria sp. FACHB-1407]MBD2462468.1 DNRLRE domain-containing protein [Oscillatoria sp. FACHB-1407]